MICEALLRISAFGSGIAMVDMRSSLHWIMKGFDEEPSPLAHAHGPTR
jgi:hypothetical protein